MRLGSNMCGAVGGGMGTPSATRMGLMACGAVGGGMGTPSATRMGLMACGAVGGGMGTPSATRTGLLTWGTVGGGAGTPSAWIAPLFQVGRVEELLTGTAMDSRIRLTESAAKRSSRLFFTGHAPWQEACQHTELPGPRSQKSSVAGTLRQTGMP